MADEAVRLMQAIQRLTTPEAEARAYRRQDTGAPCDRRRRWRATRLAQPFGRMEGRPELRSAVLLAAEEDGTVVGAWSREGAAQLWHMLDMMERSKGLLEIRHALVDGVTGP